MSLFASASGAVTEHAKVSALYGRPCTTSEDALASSPEIAQVFDEQSADNRPPFQWCEAADVDWLPGATVLRFHTAIHVDYEYTYTLLRAKLGERFSVARFGEGLVGGNASPNTSDAIKAFDKLLDSVQGPPSKARAEAACVLFLFVVGRENHVGFFRHPEGKHILSVSDYDPAFRTVAGRPVVSIRTRTTIFRFAFSSNKEKLSLASVSENAGR